jgi:hypothetical protein
MADYCTCGAQLPPDALFCHKCGKPQREILTPEIEANTYPAALTVPTAEVPPPPRPQPVPLNFHNPIAVRIALLAAVSAMVTLALSPLNVLGAGFFAVFFYRRKTGLRLDVASGVKIGWITGLIVYVFYVIVFAVQFVPDAVSGQLGKTLLDQMKTSPIQNPAAFQATAKMLESNPGMVIVLLLGTLFVMVTVMSMAGGALGAKLVGSPK